MKEMKCWECGNWVTPKTPPCTSYLLDHWRSVICHFADCKRTVERMSRDPLNPIKKFDLIESISLPFDV